MAFGIGMGDRIAIWSFEDKGTCGICFITGSEKNSKTGKWEKCFSSKAMVLGKAYENIKEHLPIPTDGHLDAKIGYGYETDGKYGKYTQKPLSFSNYSESEQYKYHNNYYFFDLTIIESKGNKQETIPTVEDIPAQQPQAAPAQNGNMLSGTVGLDFLNVPDNIQEELPFK